MKKLFTLMLFICLTFWNINLFSQEEPVDVKKQEETKEIKNNEQSEKEIKEKEIVGENDILPIQSPEGITTVSEQPSTAPEIKTFALDPNLVGAISNSVNLFSGQVNLPINLISMKGRNGLDVNVSISYSSNVKNSIDTWNLEAPTGVLGLGWQFGYSQIVVDHKGTGTREDDDFYLVEGGSSNKLVCYQINTGNRKYKTKNYQFWEITYYNSSSEERWEIIKEDGVKYIYGGDLSGNRNTVQYSSKWGNWIGNSKQDYSTSVVVAWNLSKVQNIWGEEIVFEYEVVEYTLTTLHSSSKQTEACYLKKITDNFNRQIEFWYGQKYPTTEYPNDFEYVEPHSESTQEPDAYQERYEKKYLDSIVVKNSNVYRLFSIMFGYGGFGSGNLYKRQLTSITQKNAYYESLPNLIFIYNSELETNAAALKEIKLPTGGTVAYTYGSHQIEYSELNSVAQAPSGYAEPKVYIHENYAVITWRFCATGHSEDERDVIAQIWEWDGKWIKAIEQSIGPVKLSDGYFDYSIVQENDFVGILTGVSEDGDWHTSRLSVFTKNPLVKGSWIQSISQLDLGTGRNASITSGKDFIAVRTGVYSGGWVHEGLSVYRKNTTVWTTILDRTSLGPVWNTTDGFQARNTIAAKNNYLLLFKNSQNPDQIQIYRFIEDGSFVASPNTFSLGINTNNDPSYLYTNGYAFLLFAAGPAEYIYDWDGNYSNLTQRMTIGPYPDYSSPFAMHNGFGVMKGDMIRSFLSRKNGINWVGSGEVVHSQSIVAFGEDYFVSDEVTMGDVRLRQFNPNNSSFSDEVFPRSSEQSVKAGIDIFTLNEKIYNRLTNETWVLNSSTLNLPSGYTIRHGYHFIAYESYRPSTQISYFLPIKNQQVLTEIPFDWQQIYHTWFNDSGVPKDKSELVGNNTIVSYSGDIWWTNFRDVTTLNLYKVINDSPIGKLTEYYVKGITVNDGYQNTTTAYHYYPAYGVMDPLGSVTQYNKVRVIPGGLTNYNADVHPNGYTDTYFFNGLKQNELSSAFPSNITDVTNAQDYNKLLNGSIYKTEVCNNTGTVISSTTNYYYVNEVSVGNTKCYYPQLRRKVESLDGVSKTSDYTYLTTSGLVKTQQTKNYNTAGVEETLKTEYLYGYENTGVYASLAGLNLLTPVIQTKTLNGTTLTGMSATTLKQYSNSISGLTWAPHKSYIRTTAGSTDFNFDSWSGTGEPASDWLKTSEITSIDSKGQVLEAKDVDGIYSTTHWDKNGLQVASFSNTQNATKTLSENFDDLSFTDEQPVSWTGTGGWAITSLGVLSWPTNNVSSPAYTSQQIPQDFIAEFDMRVTNTSTSTNWIGFNFRQISAGNGAGYTLRLRRDGRISLYESNNSTELAYYQLTGTNPALDWQRIRVVANSANIQIYVNGTRRISIARTTYFGNYSSFICNNVSGEFDNLIMYPDNAYASMTGYDPKFLLPIKVIDISGNVKKNVFDGFQRTIGTVGPTNIPITTGSSYLSKEGNNGNYNANDPNSILLTTVHGNFGLYNDFSTHIKNWTAVAAPVVTNPPHSASTWTLENGKLKHYDGGNPNPVDWQANLFYTDLGTSLTGRIAIEFSVKIDALSNGDGFGIGIGDNVWDLDVNNAPYWSSATWIYFNGNSNLWTINPSGSQNLANWLTPGQYHRIQIVLDVTTKKADFFVDGKACLSNFDFVKSTTANIRRITFFNYGRSTVPTTWYIDDFMVYQEPSHSMAFTDAVGKTLQTQTEETSSSIICSETLYDVLGRGYIQTMPVRLSGTGIDQKWLGYRPNFVRDFNDQTGTMNALSEVLIGSIDAYPYSRTVYELSPLSRAVEQGQPGNELRISNGHTIQNSYSKNNSGQFPINYPSNQGFVTQSINADGVNAWELKDKLGRTIATKSDQIIGSKIQTSQVSADENDPLDTFTPDRSGTATYSFTDNMYGTCSFKIGTTLGGSDIVSVFNSADGSFAVVAGTTYYIEIGDIDPKNVDAAPPIAVASVQYPDWINGVWINPISTNEYDASGNLVKIYPPNYYNPPEATSDPNGYVIEMTYDYNGRLLSKHSDDFGTVQYMYDKAGRLRFSMDQIGANQATDNVKYIKYDGLGRVTEEGYIAQNWSDIITNNRINDPSWPTTPLTWRKKYTYGLHGTDVFQRGEITQVQVNNNSDNTAEVTETYTYNVLGDVTTVSTTTGGINQALSYTYNYDGQAATVNYGLTTVYYAYDRIGRVSTIGTSSDADYYASYSYANYNGSLYQEKLNNNAVTRTLSYNNHGWLRKIEDSFMSEEMFYHTGGYGGAGYYNGNIAKITFLDKSAPGYFDYDAQFKYDNIGRMLTTDHTNSYSRYENYDLGVGTGNEIKFDANGNLLFVREGTTNRNYKYFTSTNWLKNIDGSANTQYNHDANGNISYSFTKGFGLNYDPYYNLTMSVASTGYATSFYYGADNERVYKQQSINGNPTVYKTYYYRGLSDYPLVEKNYQNSTLVSTTLYIYGPTGLIVVKDGSAFKYILKDHLGSTRMVLSSSNQIDSRYNYAPFGRLMYSSVTTDVAYKFTGQEYDDEFGLHNFRARLYDAEIGMFYAYDPAAQGFSPFGYCGNNPVIYIDKDGRLFGIDDLIIIGALVGGYLTAAAENHWEMNPGKWDWNNPETYKSLFLGLAMGGVGGAAIAAGGVNLTVGFKFLGDFSGTIGTEIASFSVTLSNLATPAMYVSSAVLGVGGISVLGYQAATQTWNNTDKLRYQLNQVRDFVGSAVGQYSTLPDFVVPDDISGVSGDYSISDQFLGDIGKLGYYDKESDAAKVGKWFGVVGQLFTGVAELKYIGAWWRPFKASKSLAGGFETYSMAWGSNIYWRDKLIKSDFFWQINAWLRSLRIPIDSWRTADPGHFHWWRK